MPNAATRPQAALTGGSHAQVATPDGHDWSLLDVLGTSVVGHDVALPTPYGAKRMVYADYTASGRSLDFVEDFLRERVLPLYANTHSESSATGLALTRLREQAREAIRQGAGAGPDTAVIFTGSGATAAVDKLIGLLGLRIPSVLDDRYHFSNQLRPDQRPVVFVGPYEHHSNELPWRETIADVIEVTADEPGHIDLEDLERLLQRYAERPLRIGSFSAASNVTGILTDTVAIAGMLHRHGALAFFDYAAAAPYVEIRMGGARGQPSTAMDAVFLSPHKFLGGPGSPGVLLVRRDLVHNRVPVVPGGGAVSFVTPTEHQYLDDVEHREEAGTPGIVECIRAGLAMRVKQAVGVDVIRERERELLARALTTWRRSPQLEILGDTDAERLAIVSFVVRAPTGLMLHHNLVVAALNDLFGVQARGGCACAGPYGHRLLGIDLDHSRGLTRAISAGWLGLKPGWVRVNLHYILDDEQADYLIDAVDAVSRHGWKLLTDYSFDARTGLWKHHEAQPATLVALEDLHLGEGRPYWGALDVGSGLPSFADQLAEGQSLLAGLADPDLNTPATLEIPAEHADAARWFEGPR